MKPIARLKELYAKNSKHSNYQILSSKLLRIIGSEQIEVKSRYERVRLDYILKHVSLNRKKILDVGGNSGFFSFEAIEEGASEVHYFEGNKAHSDFVKIASEVLDCSDKVKVANEYYSFDSKETQKYDVVFLLNVLHHLGDDYGDNTLSIEAAKKLMAAQLNNMVDKTDYLIFQLGFCWKGNRDISLFENGTKKELIDFVTDSVEGVWEIKSIGIPTNKLDRVTYDELNNQNIDRDDALGEFLNRPLFILTAK